MFELSDKSNLTYLHEIFHVFIPKLMSKMKNTATAAVAVVAAAATATRSCMIP